MSWLIQVRSNLNLVLVCVSNECVPIKAPISAADTGRLSTINSPSLSPIKPCMSPRHNTPTSKISVPMYYSTVANKNTMHSMHVLPLLFFFFFLQEMPIHLVMSLNSAHHQTYQPDLKRQGRRHHPTHQQG